MKVKLDLSQNNIYKEENFNNKANEINHIDVISEFNSLPKWLNKNRTVNSISFLDKRKTLQLILNPFNLEPDFFTCRDEGLDYLPEEICLLVNMESLDVGRLKGYGKIKQLPKNIGNLKKLKYLLLAENQINQLPDSIENCKEIEWLSLDDNPLKEFPKVIYELSNLARLSIGSVHQSSVAVDLTQMSRLEKLGSLSLYNSGIIEFPLELGRLSNLYALRLNDNLIRDLPDPERIKSSFKNLNLINLAGNPIYEEKFNSIPKWKNQLKKYGINLIFD